MKAKIITTVTLFTLLLNSCIEDRINEKLEIYGYSIGDTITDEFKITDQHGEFYSFAVYRKDTLVEISTIKNHINYFSLSLQEKEFKGTIKKIEGILGKSNVYYIGDTIRNIKLNHLIEYYLWYDSISNNSIEAYVNINNPSQNTFSLFNDTISESLKKRFIPDYGKPVKPIEIAEFE
ncbi:MAG: hypothetical protein AB7S50_14240 [Bacteroidales bacterium]